MSPSTFWPNDARLAVSFSIMFEGGGQAISGAPGVIPEPIKNNLPDLPTNGVFQYGIYEGTPRPLDLMDGHNVKLSAFMIGQAVDKALDLAREVVRRGHEAAAHGRTWTPSYDLPPDGERRFIEDNIASIQKATGQTPKGWSAYWIFWRALALPTIWTKPAVMNRSFCRSKAATLSLCPTHFI